VEEREARHNADDQPTASRPPERASPDEMAGGLMESEHRGRYLWAAALASDREVLDAGCGTGYGSEILADADARSVTGIDIAQEAIEQARSNCTHPVCEFQVGSVHELPYEDGRFDLVVCFEVIEHVDQQPRAISELRRVLKDSGVLAISSPNREVYPPGNPHHLHEFVPEELDRALAEQFANVRLYRQSPWLTSAILDTEQAQRVGREHPLHPTVMKLAAVEPGEEMYTVALASDAELPPADAVALMGKPFELRWWHDQLTSARREARTAQEHLTSARGDVERLSELELVASHEAATLREATTRARENELASAHRLLEVETLLANAQARVAALEESNDARERGIAELHERLDRAGRVQAAMQSSLSWRLTAPLRAVKRRGRRR
jgi:2-polyprenyl-3-methyl-5-hydroxy-6-metoxy-1,4-benzoquinol methylase